MLDITLVGRKCLRKHYVDAPVKMHMLAVFKEVEVVYVKKRTDIGNGMELNFRIWSNNHNTHCMKVKKSLLESYKSKTSHS